ASPSGLRWFKVAEEGLNNGQWGVDTMIRNNGWQYFTMPQCIAPGHYLMRIELIALHSAYSQGGAQFYVRRPQSPTMSRRGILTFVFSRVAWMRSDQRHRWWICHWY